MKKFKFSLLRLIVFTSLVAIIGGIIAFILTMSTMSVITNQDRTIADCQVFGASHFYQITENCNWISRGEYIESIAG